MFVYLLDTFHNFKAAILEVLVINPPGTDFIQISDSIPI